MKLRKGDPVKVVTGKDNGKVSRIIATYPDRDKVLVEGVNMVKRHQRPQGQNTQGGIIEREAPIHISNVMYWSEKEKRTFRIGYKIDSKGRRVRVGRPGEVDL